MMRPSDIAPVRLFYVKRGGRREEEGGDKWSFITPLRERISLNLTIPCQRRSQ